MDIVLLLVGIVLAAVGGELFVRGAVGIATWARIPAAIVGATIAAFATSSPELSVGVQSALAGTPDIALGDALGSNVVNLTLVVGLVLVLGPVGMDAQPARRELVAAAAAPLLTLVLLLDGTLSRVDAALLLVMFSVWIVAVVREARRIRAGSVPDRDVVADALDAVEVDDRVGRRLAIIGTLVGLVLLVLAGGAIVEAAQSIGDAIGLDPFVVGATLVAFGTSTPELATALVAKMRGHAEIGTGTVLGSNVFNNLWIVGVAAMIRPIEADRSEVAIAIVAGLVALALVARPHRGQRRAGVLLIAVYAAYATATIAVA